jgi:hypothetical protein
MTETIRTDQEAMGTAQKELERVIQARIGQGYRVESLDGSRAVLAVNGRKRMFGLRGGEEQRTEVTINEHGRAVSRNL